MTRVVATGAGAGDAAGAVEIGGGGIVDAVLAGAF